MTPGTFDFDYMIDLLRARSYLQGDRPFDSQSIGTVALPGSEALRRIDDVGLVRSLVQTWHGIHQFFDREVPSITSTLLTTNTAASTPATRRHQCPPHQLHQDAGECGSTPGALRAHGDQPERAEHKKPGSPANRHLCSGQCRDDDRQNDWPETDQGEKETQFSSLQWFSSSR